MKFGGGYNRYTKNQVIGKDSKETTPSATDGTRATGMPTGQLTGDSYLDFLLGLATNFSQANSQSDQPLRQQHHLGLCRGQLAREHRLSVQYGLRYDIAARMGAQQPGFQLRSFAVSAGARASVQRATARLRPTAPAADQLNGQHVLYERRRHCRSGRNTRGTGQERLQNLSAPCRLLLRSSATARP